MPKSTERPERANNSRKEQEAGQIGVDQAQIPIDAFTPLPNEAPTKPYWRDWLRQKLHLKK